MTIPVLKINGILGFGNRYQLLMKFETPENKVSNLHVILNITPDLISTIYDFFFRVIS